MKKYFRKVAILSTALASVAVVGTRASARERKKCERGKQYLLATQWKQMGGFEFYTPDSLRVGCWSTALAQIVYYHRLKPFGQVVYTSRQGYVVNESLDSTLFNFDLFAPFINSTTDQATVDQL
ncbi:MAG TPA: hypothetical protein VGB67_13055, partial [Fibrella sp.]